MTLHPDAQFRSKYGYFDEESSEYVITTPLTPRPWINVLSNDHYGLVYSQAGGGFSWIRDSQTGRLTRWEQDMVRDPYGRHLYLRDADTGALWSADWLPCRKAESFEVRHAPGYSISSLSAHGITTRKTLFVPFDSPCELWLLEARNDTERTRRIALSSYLEWWLGSAGDTHREFHKTFIHTEFAPNGNTIFAWKEPPVPDPGHGLDVPFLAYHALVVGSAMGWETDKASFIGRNGDIASPAGLGRTGEGLDGRHVDPIASISTELTLQPGQTQVVAYLTGSSLSRDEAADTLSRFSTIAAIESALMGVKTWWSDKRSATMVETPDPAMNLLTNVWLKHQTITGRIWARSAYYQQGGAYGYRDQLQDSHIWLPLDPARTKRQILLHAAQQYPDGGVKHWWFPTADIYAVTHHSDTPLWLPFVTLNYIDETNDVGILDERVPYLSARAESGKMSADGTLLEHCLLAVDSTLERFSARRLPLIGGGDWNDGLSHAGLQGRGESVWLAHFLHPLLLRLAEMPGVSRETAEIYRSRADELVTAVNEHGWDGEWYLAATRDDGKPLGSRSNEKGRIFLNAQTWAAIGDTAPPDRRARCMESAKTHLFREFGPLLLTPAYQRIDPSIGYLSRYAPAVRENGGVYTHASTWAIWALCLMGDGDGAWRVYKQLSPPRRCMDPDHYCAEPYVTPGNTDGPESPNFGRGGWTWYTGSAAWLFRIALDWILGVRATREGLLLDPCIPREWPGYRVRRLFRGTTYEIEVANPNHVSKGITEITVDGERLTGELLPTPQSRNVVSVAVRMG